MPSDVLPGLVGFTRALAESGVAVSTDRTAMYLDAVRHVDVVDPKELYWAGRLTLCVDPDDLPRYNEAFARWFTGTKPGGKRATVSMPKQAQIAALAPAEDGHQVQGEADPEALPVAASETEILRSRDIAELSTAERAHLRELLAQLHPAPPTRSSLRLRPARRGRLDARRTLRGMLATSGEPVRLAYARRTRRPRRVVLLIDVSGSMSPYADALLRFAHVLTRRNPATTEVFALGTRMTRLSRALRSRDPEVALTAAGHTVPDWAGGTRLGETLRAFLDRWGQRGVARHSVVVIFSDGWERGDTALLGTQLARLRRLAYRVLWVNPHAGRDGYAPVQSGIAAAWPHIDRLLAGHSLATLERLLVEMRDAGRT
ncbi:MAG: VWA domain-containing protein [Pseudonocardiaceae bacterium]|nr:VWA domain-containing protein [Pseudonocardiaceae bacterium]